MSRQKVTITTLRKKVSAGQKITMLTAYDYPTAVIEEQAGVDAIMVGDSIGTVVYGFDSTLPVTMEMMLAACGAVRRGAPSAYVTGDMPYMSYQPSIREAILNAGRFMAEAGVDAVKLEGGREVLDTVKALLQATIPVVGHLGLTPQSAARLGGYRAQGREAAGALDLLDQARQLEQAGICLLILECVPAEVAAAVVERLSIPVIGIGSGAACHGQVNIVHDLLGLSMGFSAKFVKAYADLQPVIAKAIGEYLDEVRAGEYPAAEHTYPMKSGQLEAFQDMLSGQANGDQRPGPPRR